MISNPRQGQAVTVWYGQKLHGKSGVVEVICQGKPRNNGARVDGVIIEYFITLEL